MSTIKSSTDHLTLNADGTSKDIKFQADGTEKMVLKSDGKLGVGELTPDAALDVYDSTNSNVALFDSGNTGGAHVRFQQAGTTKHYIGCDTFLNIGTVNDLALRAYDNLHIATGNDPAQIKMSVLSGGGITFNGDTATANALSDYETGSWTPSPQNCTGSALDAKYTKIGDVVHIWGRFNFTGASGEISFLGLPYSPANNQVGGSIMLTGANISGGSTYNVIIYFTTTPRILIYRSEDNSAWDTMSHSHIGNGDQMIFNGFYKV